MASPMGPSLSKSLNGASLPYLSLYTQWVDRGSSALQVPILLTRLASPNSDTTFSMQLLISDLFRETRLCLFRNSLGTVLFPSLSAPSPFPAPSLSSSLLLSITSGMS